MIDLMKKLFFGRNHSYSGRTDTGKVRSHNEDSFSILGDKGIFLVADGMGGHNAGEVASQLTIETLARSFSKDALKKIKGNNEEIRHYLVRCFNHANEVVIKTAAADETKKGMGCTLVAGMIDGKNLHTLHVGDARCYVINDDSIEQITTDHSCITEYRQTKKKSNKSDQGEDAGYTPPPRQIVTRAIGFPFPEDPEYHLRPLRNNDRVLLCSDGLWSMIDDQALQEVIKSAATPEQACDTLIKMANHAGGRDNITALVVFY